MSGGVVRASRICRRLAWFESVFVELGLQYVVVGVSRRTLMFCGKSISVEIGKVYQLNDENHISVDEENSDML